MNVGRRLPKADIPPKRELQAGAKRTPTRSNEMNDVFNNSHSKFSTTGIMLPLRQHMVVDV